MKKLLTIVAASALVIALGAVVIFAVTDRSDTADDMVSGGDPSSVTSGLEPQDSSDISVSTSDGDQQASSDSPDSSDTSSSDTQDSSADSSDTQTMTESRRPVGTYHPSGDRLLPIYNVETSEKKCAISFDAAWGADQTENILAILDEYNVKATFFLVGRWVDEFPEMVEKIAAAYEAAYGNEQFVRVVPQGRLADTKYVFMTNCCEIGYVLDPHTGRIILSSAIDNLTKGAAGQAVQCLNIRFGLPEAAGLI